MIALLSSASPYRLNAIGASRAIAAAPLGATANRVRDSAAADVTSRVSFGRHDDGGGVYGDPRARSAPTRVWSSPAVAGDTVSALMARNRGMNSYSLGDQWRGLGGALLSHFARTGQGYAQTLVDDRTSDHAMPLDSDTPEERAQLAASIIATQTADLANVAAYAPSASLTIQTRSGQSVALNIVVNAGFDGIVGMQVDLKASGPMTDSERAAIAQLAEGLDRALEGLGRDDAVALDLSGLMSYDRDLIGSIDLKANNTQTHQALSTFSLHLGDDKQSIALHGSDGALELSVDGGAAHGNTPVPQRLAAIQRTLDRMAGAGDRAHANAALVRQMQSAFTQLQAPTAPGVDEARTARSPVDSAAASHLSGLADFDASFSGAARHSNRFGSTHEASQSQYQLSQKTTATDAIRGGRSVAQTVSESLSAEILTASGADAMLDVRTGNHSTIGIHDRRTVTTLIDSAADDTTRVLRKTDEQQLKTLVDLESHRVKHRQSWPSQQSLLERL